MKTPKEIAERIHGFAKKHLPRREHDAFFRLVADCIRHGYLAGAKEEREAFQAVVELRVAMAKRDEEAAS